MARAVAAAAATAVVALVLLAATAHANAVLRAPHQQQQQQQQQQQPTVAERFAQFERAYGRVYASAAERAQRMDVFRDNAALVDRVNAERRPYVLELNAFADLTWDEFVASRLSVAAPQFCSATAESTRARAPRGRRAAVPLTKDWRHDSAVSPVKDQGHCGSCYSFSSTGALESAHYLKHGGDMLLASEQQIVDCAGAFDNHGCDGGLPSQVFEYVRYNKGIMSEASYPYTAKDGNCTFDASKVIIRVAGETNITQDDEKGIVDAVGLKQPVSVAFEVVDDFRFYKKGVYTSQACGSKPTDVNHAVLAVGYNIETSTNPKYWIIKNSWGADWGMDGYFEMEYGKNMCGVATCASYPHVE